MAKKSVAKRAAAKSGEKPELTKSANEAISLKQASEQRAATVATNRWAILKKTDGHFDKDARTEVINICMMDPPDMPPQISEDLIEQGNEVGDTYFAQKVGPGVIIGMREGGEFESTDGFGWRDPADKLAHGSPVGNAA